MDRYVEKCQSDWEFKGKQKKKKFQHLGKKPESAQIHWPSFAAYKT